VPIEEEHGRVTEQAIHRGEFEEVVAEEQLPLGDVAVGGEDGSGACRAECVEYPPSPPASLSKAPHSAAPASTSSPSSDSRSGDVTALAV
jgi:hypothetical protein